MKLSCEKKELWEAVSTVQRAVSVKSTLPALEGILLKAHGEILELTAYDLELGIVKAVPADIKEEGAAVLNAKIFSAIVKKMPAGKIGISLDDKNTAIISNGATEFSILGTPASEFPDIPVITEKTSFSVSQGILSSMIRQTLFSVSSDDSKPVHTGSMFELSENQVRIASVDGFRLAIRTEKISNSLEMKFVVPGKTLSELLKMLDPDSDSPVQLNVSKKHIIFEMNGYTVISRLLEGNFLDYKAVLSGQQTSEITANVKYLTESIERAALVTSEKLKAPIICNFDIDFAMVHCATAIGKSYDRIPISIIGEPLKEIGFSSIYMLDALHALECEKVKILLNGQLAPIKLVPTQGDSFLFLVLPVRLKNE